LKELWEFFIVFARMGGLTFGGGYAMLPILQKEVVEKRGWATEAELLDYYAIGQCTPGIIAINTATFIGYKRRGIAGGIAATLGVVFPSFVIISVIAAFLSHFADIKLVQDAFWGIRISVCLLILDAVRKFMKKSVVDKVSLVLFLLVFFGVVMSDLSPVEFILASGAAGLIVKRMGGGR
jgi:chromate transporter